MASRDSPYCVSVIESIQEHPEQDLEFYAQLIRLEQEYRARPSEELVEQLIKLYSDCIHYFEQGSEPVSYYFQHKMKKLILNKRKIDKQQKIGQQVESNIRSNSQAEKIVVQHTDSLGKYQNKVTSIIDMQKQILAERRLNKRRQITASSPFTMSMDSLFESPEKSSGRSLILSKTKLFESLMDDEDNMSEN